jgi:hypothetical protein
VYHSDVLTVHLTDWLANNGINYVNLTGEIKDVVRQVLTVNNDPTIKVVLVDGHKLSSHMKFLKSVDKIIVLDREYEYILKKESIGYDFINKLHGITIDIYESAS